MRKLAKKVALAAPVGLAMLSAVGYAAYRSAMAQAEAGWRTIAAGADASVQPFDRAMVADLPEVARRYFAHAIAPGTPLRTTVELQMRGTFLLGDKVKHQRYMMEARQILRPPSAFVWMPRLKSGAMRITGSDALVDGAAWTSFWLLGLLPVADVRTSPDLVRSASFRSAVEGIWAPASLLPQNGIRWEQTGPDEARIHIESVKPEIVLEMKLAPNGAVREFDGLRWSNANPETAFRLQPFGGTIHAETTFGGFTIPSVLNVGNHFGTNDYLAFFQVEIVSAAYL